MSREEYLRVLIEKIRPVAKPNIDYAEVLRQLHRIGNNIRQTAIRAYCTNHVDGEAFKQYSRELDEVISGLTLEMARRTNEPEITYSEKYLKRGTKKSDGNESVDSIE